MRNPNWCGFFFVLLAALILAPMGCGCGDDDDDDDDDDSGDDDSGPVDSAEQFIERVVTQNGPADGEAWQAFVSAEAFAAADTVQPAFGDGDEAPTGDGQWAPDAQGQSKSAPSKFSPDGDYWFAFVDPNPYAAFEHDVVFSYADADTGESSDEPESSWAVINDEAVYLSSKTLWRVYAPGTAPSDYAAPAKSAAKALGGTAYTVLIPNWDDNTVQVRFLIAVDGSESGTRYVNVAVDNDRDGAWGSGARGAEWLVKNAAVELKGGESWVWTDPVTLPVDSDRKFGYENWTRVAMGDSKISGDDWDGLGASDAADYYFNFLPWSGPGYGEDDDPAGIVGPDEPPLSPLVLESQRANKVAGVYICEPDEYDIGTERKALVINLGDHPGNSWMDRNARRAEMGFNLIMDDGAATRLDRPTAAEALTAIQNFLSGMKCLDEYWIYITGHGNRVSGQIRAQNGLGLLSWWEIAQYLNEHSANCPRVMNYSETGCRQNGYCNLNFIVQSCYSGWWTKNNDANSLRRWGINVLTSAGFNQESLGRPDGDGSYISNAFWNGYFQNEADKSANGGNADGVVSPKEAMRYARDHQEGDDTGGTVTEGGNCDCHCEDCAWYWGDRLFDLKFYTAKAEGPDYVDFMDIDTYSIVEVGNDYTVTISYSGDLPQPGDSGFYEFYAVFDANAAWSNETADSPTYGGDTVYIASFQSGAWGEFLFNRSTGTWTSYATTMTADINGNTITMHIDGTEAGFDLGETIGVQVATWSRDAANNDYGDTTDAEVFTPPVLAASAPFSH